MKIQNERNAALLQTFPPLSVERSFVVIGFNVYQQTSHQQQQQQKVYSLVRQTR